MLLLRADAGLRLGTGHVMRCLALAQAWQDRGGKALLLGNVALPQLVARLQQVGVAYQPLQAEAGSPADASRTAETAREARAGWVVLDGYSFGAGYQQRLKDVGLRVLLVDDFGQAEHYHADYVLNQNLSADERWYVRRDAGSQLLLGPRFVMLRREFAECRRHVRGIPTTARKLLVTLGGSDPDNVTLTILRALHQTAVAGLHAIVIAGAGNPHLESLAAACRAGPATIELRTNVADMVALLAWADLAIGAGGTTSWERAALGLPSLVVVLAENQRAIASALARAGISWNLGEAGSLTAESIRAAVERGSGDLRGRETMSARAAALIDGQGAGRVADLLLLPPSPPYSGERGWG